MMVLEAALQFGGRAIKGINFGKHKLPATSIPRHITD
jgi:hypothetical protein